jgi:hypothetical protein
MLGFGTSGKQKVQERLPDFFVIGWDKFFHGYDADARGGRNSFIIYTYLLFIVCDICDSFIRE